MDKIILNSACDCGSCDACDSDSDSEKKTGTEEGSEKKREEEE